MCCRTTLDGESDTWLITMTREFCHADTDDERRLRPLDTQCLIFTLCSGSDTDKECDRQSAVVVAFRGSQPVEFWDWFYNFTVDTLPEGGIRKDFRTPNGIVGNEADVTLKGTCISLQPTHACTASATFPHQNS